MPENNKTEEFLQKLAPCIERGELEACVEEAARMAGEMGIGAGELVNLSAEMGVSRKHDFSYILALAAVQGLEGNKKARAYSNAGFAAQYLEKLKVAEVYYKKAIELNSDLAATRFIYANLLKELNRTEEAEIHYKKSIEINPKLAEAQNNYANLLKELNIKDEAEEHYKKAIEANPKFAEAHYNYAILLHELNRKSEAKEHYTKAIEINPKYASAYNNFANLLKELNWKTEAEEHYKKAIESNPKLAEAHNNYAVLLEELNRKEEAEEHYTKAIEINPKYAEAHNNYAQLLIDYDKRKEAWDETELASNLFQETGRITQSYLAKAWFYQGYSEKNFSRKKFRESSDDSDKAGTEYLKAAETADGSLKDNLTLQGNVLKAKSFVRKIPEKSWYKKIYYRFGKNPYIPELIENLKNAAIYYEKASQCPVGESKDVCNACFSSMNVFSETLSAMSAFIKGEDADINKDKWLTSLEHAHKIYNAKGLNNGAALVDTLKQLIKCVNELAEHRKIGLHIQEERLGKCYTNLMDVSEKLDGALKVIADHSVEAIRDYAKKQGMSFVGEEKPKKSLWDIWLIKAILAILTVVAAIIAMLQFLHIDLKALDFIKSLIFR